MHQIHYGYCIARFWVLITCVKKQLALKHNDTMILNKRTQSHRENNIPI